MRGFVALALLAASIERCAPAFFFALLLTLGAPALAQDDTALHREVYADVNKRKATMRSIEARGYRPGAGHSSELTAWVENGEVRKIAALERDDAGDVATEFYYRRGRLLFVYQAIKGHEKGRKQVTRVENRLYFRDGRLLHMLGGAEKAPQDPQSPDFREAEAAASRASDAFLDAVRRAR
jgi:hypothetical protein